MIRPSPCKSSAAIVTKLLLLVGIVGSVCVLLSSDLSPDLPLQTQKRRKQQLREMCDSGENLLSNRRRSLEELSDKELEKFIVDDRHGIIYCFVPKVACTNWKRVMFVLGKEPPYQDPMSVPGHTVHHRDQLTYLKDIPQKEKEAKMKHYTKFLFVRDPFVRLISAYRNKFEKCNFDFYNKFGRFMLQRYGNQPTPPKMHKEAYALGIRPSFYNFIQYLLDPETEKKTPFDEHWMQMHRLCHPCLIDYDFIGHLESLEEDANLLLKMLKLEDEIQFPAPQQNLTTSDSVLDWFATVPLDDRRKLYKLYEEDFRLFGYRKPDELLHE